MNQNGPKPFKISTQKLDQKYTKIDLKMELKMELKMNSNMTQNEHKMDQNEPKF